MTPSPQPREDNPRDAAWARPVARLKVDDVPTGALNINVDGRQVVGPLQGFGQLWQKTYWVRLTGLKASPAEVMTIWKQNFPKFWPRGNHFYPSLVGIAPGASQARLASRHIIMTREIAKRPVSMARWISAPTIAGC